MTPRGFNNDQVSAALPPPRARRARRPRWRSSTDFDFALCGGLETMKTPRIHWLIRPSTRLLTARRDSLSRADRPDPA